MLSYNIDMDPTLYNLLYYNINVIQGTPVLQKELFGTLFVHGKSMHNTTGNLKKWPLPRVTAQGPIL